MGTRLITVYDALVIARIIMGAVVQGWPALRASTRASSADADRRTRRGLWITGRAEGA